MASATGVGLLGPEDGPVVMNPRTVLEHVIAKPVAPGNKKAREEQQRRLLLGNQQQMQMRQGQGLTPEQQMSMFNTIQILAREVQQLRAGQETQLFEQASQGNTQREILTVATEGLDVGKEGVKVAKEGLAETKKAVALGEKTLAATNRIEKTTSAILSQVKSIRNDFRTRGILAASLDHELLVTLVFFLINPLMPFTGQILQAIYILAYSTKSIIHIFTEPFELSINGVIRKIYPIAAVAFMATFWYQLYTKGTAIPNFFMSAAAAKQTCPAGNNICINPNMYTYGQTGTEEYMGYQNKMEYNTKYYNPYNMEMRLGHFVNSCHKYFSNTESLLTLAKDVGNVSWTYAKEFKTAIRKAVDSIWPFIRSLNMYQNPGQVVKDLLDWARGTLEIVIVKTGEVLKLPPYQYALGKMTDAALWVGKAIWDLFSYLLKNVLKEIWDYLSDLVTQATSWLSSTITSAVKTMISPSSWKLPFFGKGGNGQIVLYQNPQISQLTFIQGASGNLAYQYMMLRLHAFAYPASRPSLQPILLHMGSALEGVLTLIVQPELGFTNFHMLPQPKLLDDASSITEGLETIAKGIRREWKNIPNNNRNKYAIVPYVAPKGGKRKTRKGKSIRRHVGTRKRSV